MELLLQFVNNLEQFIKHAFSENTSSYLYLERHFKILTNLQTISIAIVPLSTIKKYYKKPHQNLYIWMCIKKLL